ncbi:ATP-binding protein [Pseudomonas sp. P5_152]|uniref:sensor histidine kinase n=1 Tax=Pseudomonas sp. P5_152 TaxID=3043442 RepID=UPI002A371417|nr:ATP-binding protein [Pseudomonas sp. P5_152]MDX9663462.1 ATP-binding protein [Pseudomonas sp. P5_152]
MDGWQKRLKESIQLRLSLALSLAILLVAVMAAAFAFISALDEAHEMQDDALRQVALLVDRQQMNLHYPKGLLPAGDDEETRLIVQYLADGSQAAGNDDRMLPLPFPTTLADGIATLTVGGEAFRVLVRTTTGGERIVVAQEVGARDKDARESAWRSLLPFLILFPVLLLVVSDLVHKVFRPIAVLSQEIDQRAEQELHPLDERSLPTEIRPFVVAINRLLERVANAMEAQRRFVADSAHELRSPLTALSLQVEHLAAAPMSPLAHERLMPLRRGIERGRKLLDQLLALARAQAGPPLPSSPLSVHAVYRRVLEDLLPLAEAKHIDIGVEGAQDLLVQMQEVDLVTLVKNLVDNAIRYTPEGGRIDLCLDLDQGAARLSVKDSGPGIPTEEQQRVFDPFFRGLGSQQVGSGLGLSIVKAITERVGARIALSVADPEQQRGLCIAVWLPRVKP